MFMKSPSISNAAAGSAQFDEFVASRVTSAFADEHDDNARRTGKFAPEHVEPSYLELQKYPVINDSVRFSKRAE